MINLSTAKTLSESELLKAYLDDKLDSEARDWALKNTNIHERANSYARTMFGG